MGAVAQYSNYRRNSASTQNIFYAYTHENCIGQKFVMRGCDSIKQKNFYGYVEFCPIISNTIYRILSCNLKHDFTCRCFILKYNVYTSDTSVIILFFPVSVDIGIVTIGKNSLDLFISLCRNTMIRSTGAIMIMSIIIRKVVFTMAFVL